MNVDSLKEEFFSLVAPDLPNEWDVEEAIEQLAGVDTATCKSALGQVHVIWPVSHSLCFDYLKTVPAALECIDTDNLPEWVNATLDQYEKEGLRAAQRFMADVEANFLCPRRGESGATYRDVQGRLLPYLRGLSGRPLDLARGTDSFTDTSTVFIPEEISLLPTVEDNFFLYKLMVSYQWAFIACSSFTVSNWSRAELAGQDAAAGPLWLETFLATFADPKFAARLYHFLETLRVTAFLEKELPGLMRRKAQLLPGLPGTMIPDGQGDELGSMLAHLSRVAGLPGDCGRELNGVLEQLHHHLYSATSADDSVTLTSVLYPRLHSRGVDLGRGVHPDCLGTMDLAAVRHARNLRLETTREQFVDALATHLLTLPETDREKALSPVEEAGGGGTEEGDGSAMVTTNERRPAPRKNMSPHALTINNEEMEMDEQLEQLVSSIVSELGFLPDQYVASAVGRAGKGAGIMPSAQPQDGFEIMAPIVYDEWDFRRNDFRKKWCRVHEKAIPLTHSNFYSRTRDKYHGQIIKLRHQFEMMRTAERFVRRQRDGDDIDLDALVESMADVRAGLPPADRLFVRLKRDERDIAVVFLIDMSNSTQGWVNQAIRESLILLCEALEVVGDRYAVYGFSGMRRLRSEFFHIKHLDESYSESVRHRIASIAPREYTRMGAALRHATSLLQKVDARVRLLITLSDGKPEDYDDYKGEYAIEDTRHALFEAKAAGIHPFCITVDRHAAEYIDHMYGSVNNIRIDDVRKLPHRMTEIYRVLTG